ncbi:pseudouridine synthase [Azospirillum sp.]|uniref:pseudouridine synthase n=1 Tax=Azospirillum sp. TaxID=34012 RepID=UPI002D6498BA|nr:pseudouridine synthase [Azospirillum sp.]HYD69364.1 pseudouridine synthase [Azospirillum sp.]
MDTPSTDNRTPPETAAEDASGGERIAKRLARAGLCSRRDAERWIADGRVEVNGRTLNSPAFVVRSGDVVIVDGKLVPEPEPARLWRYHKPAGLVTTARDEKGRTTVFEKLPPEMPRVVSVGRLDLTTEGLLLLTNDGELARFLELPSTGWTRRYRVRVHGAVDEKRLAGLAKGLTIEGVQYGPIEATLDRVQGSNAWLTVGIKEGKNREIRKVMESLGLVVNRLIRTAYGPFQLGKLPEGEVEEVPRRVVKDQLARFFSGRDGEVADTAVPVGTAKAAPKAAFRGGGKGGGKPEAKPANSPLRASTKPKPAARAERSESGEAPAERPFAEGRPQRGKPAGARPGEGRPARRAHAEAPAERTPDRVGDDKPRGGKRPGGASAGAGKPARRVAEAPSTDWSPMGKPRAGKPGAAKPADVRPVGAKPGGAKSAGAKPGAGKPARRAAGEGSADWSLVDEPRGGKPAGAKPGAGKPPRRAAGEAPAGKPAGGNRGPRPGAGAAGKPGGPPKPGGPSKPTASKPTPSKPTSRNGGRADRRR